MRQICDPKSGIQEIGYFDGGAKNCPHCKAPHIRREIDRARVMQDESEATPRILLPCYCAACGDSWVESYRLTSVSW